MSRPSGLNATMGKAALRSGWGRERRSFGETGSVLIATLGAATRTVNLAGATLPASQPVSETVRVAEPRPAVWGARTGPCRLTFQQRSFSSNFSLTGGALGVAGGNSAWT